MTPLFLTDDTLLARYWPDVERLIRPVVEHAARGEFNLDDLRRACVGKTATAAIAIDDGEVVLAMVFEFLHYPRMSACNIMALGGRNMAEAYERFFVTFKKWLYGMGVTVIEASCSSAMSRFLARYGFEKTYEVVRHAIEDQI
jgi:hypothetical protein